MLPLNNRYLLVGTEGSLCVYDTVDNQIKGSVEHLNCQHLLPYKYHTPGCIVALRSPSPAELPALRERDPGPRHQLAEPRHLLDRPDRQQQRVPPHRPRLRTRQRSDHPERRSERRVQPGPPRALRAGGEQHHHLHRCRLLCGVCHAAPTHESSSDQDSPDECDAHCLGRRGLALLPVRTASASASAPVDPCGRWSKQSGGCESGHWEAAPTL